MKHLQVILAAGAGLTLAASWTPGDNAQSATASTAAAASSSARTELRAGATRYVVAPSGNEVRYRVREQLAGFDLPNDAVGKTSSITGAITLDAGGRVIPAESRFTVDASTFVSDRDRRDNYVRSRSLEAQQFPEIRLVPTELRGLKLPVGGTATFEVVGDLTVRAVSRPTVWRVTAQFVDGRVSGTASTRFVFGDFQMEKPRVRSVLSVADTIALEYDFNLIRDGTGSAP